MASLISDDVLSLHRLFGGDATLTVTQMQSLYALIGGSANEAAEKIYVLMGEKEVESITELFRVMVVKEEEEEANFDRAWGLPQPQHGDSSLGDWIPVETKKGKKTPTGSSSSFFQTPPSPPRSPCGDLRILRLPPRQTAQKARDNLRLFEDSPLRPFLKELNEGLHSRLLLILRGVPGSGKSTLANLIFSLTASGTICSADNFFTSPDGRYNFDKSKLSEAHLSSQAACEAALRDRLNVVVVDNTNTRRFEVEPYVKMGVKHNYEIRLLEPQTKWKGDAKTLSVKNSHGVPREAISNMLQRFEKLSVEGLIKEAVKRLEPSQRYQPPSESKVALSRRGGEVRREGSPAKTSSKPLLNLSEFVLDATSSKESKGGPPASPAAKSPAGGGRAPSPWVAVPSSNNGGGAMSSEFPDLPSPAPKRSLGEEELFLLNSFPVCGEEELLHFFELCQFDLNDTISLLLDSGYPMSDDPSKVRPSLLGPPHPTTTPVPPRPPSPARPLRSRHTSATSIQSTVDLNHNERPSSSASNRSSKQTTSSEFTRAESPSQKLSKNMRQVRRELVNEDEILVDGPDWLDLKLPDEFCASLYATYGEICGHTPSELKSRDKLIRIPPELAFSLFSYVYLNIHQRQQEEVEATEAEEPEELAPHEPPPVQLNPSELARTLREYKDLEEGKCHVDTSVDLNVDEVMAIETNNAQIEEEKTRIRTNIPRTLAFRIRLNDLKRSFPSLSPDLLDDALVLAGFNYDAALHKMKASAPHKFVKSADPTSHSQVSQQSSKAAAQLELEEREYDPDKVAAMSPEQIEEMDAEAQYWQRQTEMLSADLDAVRESSKSQRGAMSGRGFYSLAVDQLRWDVSAAQDEYAYFHLLRLNGGKDSRQIDLHGQPVRHGVRFALKYLQNRQRWVTEHLRRGQRLNVRIITGWGKHSRNNVSQLRIQVINTLTTLRYSYYINPGEILVHLSPQT